MIFRHKAEGLDPVSAVEVVNGVDHFIGGGVDVSTDDAGAFFVFGEQLELFFVAPDEGDGRLDLGLDGF